ncbi:carbohydrate ABC transporter permease [Bifidobacterium longum]
MMSKRAKTWFTILMVVITVLMVFPLLWMLMMSFKSNAEIMSDPLSWPKALNWDNYRNALKTLNYPRLYLNTFVVCVVSLIIELTITFFSSFALARMTYKRPGLTKAVYAFLIAGLSVTPFILLFPVYKINMFFGLKEQWALIMPYVASSISFNTLLFVGYLKALPAEIDEAAVIDGCSIWDLMFRVILPMTKPVIATVVIFQRALHLERIPVRFRDAAQSGRLYAVHGSQLLQGHLHRGLRRHSRFIGDDHHP